MKKREAKVGMKIEHHPTGAYLGVITELTPNLVRFNGPRRRDGYPVTFATYSEVRPVAALTEEDNE